MTWLALPLLAWLTGGADFPTAPGLHKLQADVPGAGTVLYAVSVPSKYTGQTPVPLVVVLHSGGERMRYYGAAFMQFLSEPALRDMGAIMIAPDCPTAAWSDPASDAAVMTLVKGAMSAYAIDPRRILVTGYSMGGQGTWHFAANHADVFTAAIPMAASTRNVAVDRLGAQPTYVIHSRADELVPFGPAEQNAKRLAANGKPVHFEGLWGFGHFEMDRYTDALRKAGRWVTDQWGAR